MTTKECAQCPYLSRKNCALVCELRACETKFISKCVFSNKKDSSNDR